MITATVCMICYSLLNTRGRTGHWMNSGTCYCFVTNSLSKRGSLNGRERSVHVSKLSLSQSNNPAWRRGALVTAIKSQGSRGIVSGVSAAGEV